MHSRYIIVAFYLKFAFSFYIRPLSFYVVNECFNFLEFLFF